MISHAAKINPTKGKQAVNHQAEARRAGTFQFVDNRSEATSQKHYQDIANNSAQATQLKELQHSFNESPIVQAMKIRTTDKGSIVSGTTQNKHVVADGAQAAAAASNYGSSTFVRSDAVLTAAVDADAHNFTELATVPSARYDFNASVVIDQYDKTEAPPGGLAKNKPVSKTIDNTSTSCEIGVQKGGDEKLKVTHFKKN